MPKLPPDVRIVDLSGGAEEGDQVFFAAIPIRFRVANAQEASDAAHRMMARAAEVIEEDPAAEVLDGALGIVALQVTMQAMVAGLQERAAEQARDN